MWTWPSSYGPGLHFFFNKMERTAALPSIRAMLPDQTWEGAANASWALSNNRRLNLLVIWKERIIKVSIYLFASTGPRHFWVKTQNPHNKYSVTLHTMIPQQIFMVCGLTSPYRQFQGCWECTGKLGRRRNRLGGQGRQVIMKSTAKNLFLPFSFIFCL